MAEQDFNINIRATANTAAIQLTAEQLTALQKAAAEGNEKAIAALKKIESAQKAADRETVQGIRNASAYGLIVGGIVAKAINDLANSQNRVTKELAEQGALLVKNVIEWNKLAQASGSMEELAGAGEKAVSQIDLLRAKFNEANSETLTLTENIQDLIVKFTTWTPFQSGPNQALLDERIKGLMTDLSTAEQSAAQTFKRRFDEIKQIGEGIDPVIEKTTKDLEKARNTLAGLNPKDNLQSWVAQEQVVMRLTQRLAELNRQRAAMVKSGEPTTQTGILTQQLGKLNQAAKLPLSTTDETALRNAQIATEKKLRDSQIADQARERSMDSSAMGRARSILPSLQPGESQIQFNSELISVLGSLARSLDRWQ